ncbi:MAG: hypothetical protein HF976_04570 [ANME-2 cluster archaeon]|nr:hypothetical protein [ANME-2 cluster archaeon]MBC2706178.1 hypothetical protein [ANME-2 cluster archaeon]MBC2747009.1 hypothetical protein [ANME-2 cluster archaeon]
MLEYYRHTASHPINPIPQGGIFKGAQKICRTWKLHRDKLSPYSNRKQAEAELDKSVVTKQNNLYNAKEVKDINE